MNQLGMMIVCAMGAASGAYGQSLLRPADARAGGGSATTPPPPGANAPVPANEDLRSLSMMYIEPPLPRQYHIHDQMTILIDETSQSQSKESLETKKDFKLDAKIKSFPSIKDLLEGELRTGESNPIVTAGAEDKQNWKGEGSYSRNDRLTAKVSAKIIDVKPNGTLVVEARKTITTNDEIKTLVLSGTCRREDVTDANTVLSSQLADLAIVQTTEGELKDTSEKGWITEILEAIFNF